MKRQGGGGGGAAGEHSDAASENEGSAFDHLGHAAVEFLNHEHIYPHGRRGNDDDDDDDEGCDM